MLCEYPQNSRQAFQPVAAAYSEVPKGSEVAAEQARAVTEALSVLQSKLRVLRGSHAVSKTETSELLRDTCQALSDLVTSLEAAWHKAHPGEPQPLWALEVVPEEELARIGWDFHANRVQQLRSTWDALWCAGLEGGYAQPPSIREAADALSRVASRLGDEV
mmetsp:Transcript_66509/g.187337  ORF Transcript_66509/g.187337 Transcript_66509/m.187337 type:complete len:162 (-) Transcript_66509:135-620(-)